MTVNVHEAELPRESYAVQVTVVVPMGKDEPLGGVQTMFVITPQVLEAGGSG